MITEIHTLAWPNTDARMLDAHRKVCSHLGLDVQYTLEERPHGLWMNSVMMNSKADVVGFLDIDCVPTNIDIVNRSIEFVRSKKSFVGVAQVSNHIAPYSHIYAAPAFFFMWRETWEKLGRPTFAETKNGDVGENVSYAAELSRLKYATLFPKFWTKEPTGGLWPVHTRGHYGIGTLFEGGVYHLYQARMNSNIDLFMDVCGRICSDSFSTEGMHPSYTAI